MIVVSGSCWDCGASANPPDNNFLCVECSEKMQREANPATQVFEDRTLNNIFTS